MEILFSILSSPLLPIVIGVVVIIALLFSMVKVVNGNEVLVVTGVGATKKVRKKVKRYQQVETTVHNEETGKDETATILKPTFEEVEVEVPTIKVAGAAIVIPVIQRAKRFDICVHKTSKDGDTMKTKTGVEIDIDWGFSYSPNSDRMEELQSAIRQFLDKNEQEIEEILKDIVAGGMRAVISQMTPLEAMIGKDELDDKVRKNISDTISELGYTVRPFIQEVRDAKDSTYYHDIAAKDREETHRQAENIKAENSFEIRKKTATTDKDAKIAELDAEVATAEQQKTTDIKKADFKIETEQKNVEANNAQKVAQAQKNREIATLEGAVEVEKKRQENLAKKEEQEVAKTEAETAKATEIIRKEGEARQREIFAEAEANVARTKAQGDKDAAITDAEGKAEAKKREAEADANYTAETGRAEAEKIRAIGEAEAAAIEAKGLANAKAEMELAKARAANEGVNFRIQQLEIEANARIQIATNVATVMADIGKNAQFIDMGGSSKAGNGNVFSNILGSLPELLKQVEVSNEALNGGNLGETIGQLLSSAQGALNSSNDNAAKYESDNSNISDTAEDIPDDVDSANDDTDSADNTLKGYILSS
ncbi:hypothetical protein IKG54_01750 [Candidatus Saccharibacteria bacterium]|nr:hypothetical protein [Candidatus Saccharibacteria bacterium]